MTRLDKLREKFTGGYDAYLATSELNIRYLCGVDYTDGFLLITKDKAWMLADSRYIEVARNTANKEFEVKLLAGNKYEIIKGLIPAGTKIGFEDNVMTCADLEAYKNAMPGYEFVPTGLLVEELRHIKDDGEKALMAEAQRITDAAFAHILGYISTDITEKDVALELEHFMKKQGADGLAFDTIAVNEKSSSRPHGVPADKKLVNGFLTMDFGARYHGYCADMTRTICIGKPDEEMKKVYYTVLEAQTAAIEYMAAGKVCGDCDKVARDIINKAGYEGYFGHSLGHGVGLYIHEGIRVAPNSKQILRAGNVVTAEPGIYIAGKYGVRIEDMLYITENGNFDFPKADKSFIIL